jgi:hypothetical protein
MPLTNAVAMDVPEFSSVRKPVPLREEKMLTLGAVTSGFSPLSPLRGPEDVKLRLPKSGLTAVPSFSICAVLPAAAVITASSVEKAERTGIAPPWPPTNSTNGPSLIITTAPAFDWVARITRSATVHWPRRVTTMSPGWTVA